MDTNLETIYLEWQNNPDFRAAFKDNPEIALKKAGFTVSVKDLIKIKNTLNDTNTRLDDRLHK